MQLAPCLAQLRKHPVEHRVVAAITEIRRQGERTSNSCAGAPKMMVMMYSGRRHLRALDKIFRFGSSRRGALKHWMIENRTTRARGGQDQQASELSDCLPQRVRMPP